MASWMVALTVLLILKELHYPAMLASMMLWVDWMVDSLALNLLLGLSLDELMAQKSLLARAKACWWEGLILMARQLDYDSVQLR